MGGGEGLMPVKSFDSGLETLLHQGYRDEIEYV